MDANERHGPAALAFIEESDGGVPVNPFV